VKCHGDSCMEIRVRAITIGNVTVVSSPFRSEDSSMMDSFMLERDSEKKECVDVENEFSSEEKET